MEAGCLLILLLLPGLVHVKGTVTRLLIYAAAIDTMCQLYRHRGTTAQTRAKMPVRHITSNLLLRCTGTQHGHLFYQLNYLN